MMWVMSSRPQRLIAAVQKESNPAGWYGNGQGSSDFSMLPAIPKAKKRKEILSSLPLWCSPSRRSLENIAHGPSTAVPLPGIRPQSKDMTTCENIQNQVAMD